MYRLINKNSEIEEQIQINLFFLESCSFFSEDVGLVIAIAM